MAHDLQLYFDVALELTKQAGDLIRERIVNKKNVSTKASPIDLVTETDQEVEKLLISGLKERFPDHQFIGEETTSESGQRCTLTSAPTWIIDPVDGTLNFVHSNPSVCVSVGLYIDKEPHIGIIHVPVFNQMYTAIKGQGAYLNNVAISVSKETEISNALLYLEGGTSYDPEKIKCVKENINRLFPTSHGYRASGSAAYNFAMVALGGADAFLEFGCHAWDMAAGCVIVREAGGVVIDPSGGEFDIMSCRVIAASSHPLAQQIASLIVQYVPKRDDQ